MNLSNARNLADDLFAGVPFGADPAAGVRGSLRTGDGAFDPLRCARLFVAGPDEARAAVARALGRLDPDMAAADRERQGQRVVDEVLAASVQLSGAEVVAVLLAAGGVEQVFAYAGTSELALCDAVSPLPGITLTNGRGDKESAFMAAGASLLRPNCGAAILHAARGLTNAAGALADARRVEAGTVFVVGLPSTGSVRFLPPHGELGLIEALGRFARWSWEAPPLPDEPDDRSAAAVTYVHKMNEAITVAARQPWGPVLFGLPQDVSERRWVPLVALAQGGSTEVPAVAGQGYEAAASLVRAARRPAVLIDDYALRSPGVRVALDRFSRRTGAAVLQLRYRRGLMLFERLQTAEVANFVGWLNPFSAAHRRLLDDCDLLVTVEDRNMYRRVAGDLPSCRKLAINTDPAKVLKNEYLEDDDLLVEGDAATVLNAVSDRLDATTPAAAPPPWFAADVRAGSDVNPEPSSKLVYDGRRRVALAVAGLLSGWSRPVLVDDSSMFGGLLAEHYDDLPSGLRVFGGHGGFVGCGLAYAIGLALAESDSRVLCTLGDQAFTNSYQALVAAVQSKVRLLLLVCNNGGSVSLKKQATASYGAAPRRYLENASGFDYREVSRALGVPAERVAVPVGAPSATMAGAVAELSAVLDQSASVDGPALVELVLPADPEAWRGIWVTQGFELSAPVTAG